MRNKPQEKDKNRVTFFTWTPKQIINHVEKYGLVKYEVKNNIFLFKSGNLNFKGKLKQVKSIWIVDIKTLIKVS